ncbi:inositol-trisphosphate 3-kinase A isoform X3 [Hyalella azteca]|uniref:Kinase n=1 Tax=Hyalella azteca TaxID=294128 RepID=A0A8B7PIT2_HYAAZ|nr:inositol-trisphosphate 3-kinase A isoform X3 [Hyalella azteca]
MSSSRDGTHTPPIHVTAAEGEKCLVTLSPGYDTYQLTLLLPLPTEYDSASHDDLSADETYELPLQESPPAQQKTSNWRKVKNVVQWTPFIQTYKRHKYPWVQLAGHQGNFKAGDKQGTILKKLCLAEQRALERLMKDKLEPYVPRYLGLVDKGDQEQYLELQDLLSNFTAPCVMDIKMGVRTYLEEELAKARVKPKLRKDMFEKMVQIDPNAPSDAEQRAQAVTKPRYMVWRETISSTATLGFRIEGVKKSDGTSSKDFKTTRTQEQVLESLASFVQGYDHAPARYLKRLKEIRATLESSEFFKSHELIGSSLLFVHNEDDAVVWLIDFAKSIPLPDDVVVTHKVPWVEGSHEDGYLIGLDNLIALMTTLDSQVNQSKKEATEHSSSRRSSHSNNPLDRVKNSVSKIQTLQNDVLKGAAHRLENLQLKNNDSGKISNSTSLSNSFKDASSPNSQTKDSSIVNTKVLSENDRNTDLISVNDSSIGPDLRTTGGVSSS